MAPRSAEQFESIREESRRAIFDAALVLFARHGYEGTSVRMIAKEAGISQGLLYNYFAGKEDLLHAIMQRGLADVRESFVAAMAGGGNPIESLFQSSVAILRRNRHFWLLFYSIRQQPAVIESLAGEIEGLSRQIHEGLEAILRSAGAENPVVEAHLLFALVDGISQQFVLDPERYPVSQVIDRALALLGAASRGTP